MERNVEIDTDSEKKKIVRIHNIRFKGKRSIDWGKVREYLKNYVGAVYEIAETKDMIYIGSQSKGQCITGNSGIVGNGC